MSQINNAKRLPGCPAPRTGDCGNGDKNRTHPPSLHYQTCKSAASRPLPALNLRHSLAIDTLIRLKHFSRLVITQTRRTYFHRPSRRGFTYRVNIRPQTDAQYEEGQHLAGLRRRRCPGCRSEHGSDNSRRYYRSVIGCFDCSPFNRQIDWSVVFRQVQQQQRCRIINRRLFQGLFVGRLENFWRRFQYRLACHRPPHSRWCHRP